MQHIGHGQVDGLDGWIGQHGLVIFVCPRQAQVFPGVCRFGGVHAEDSRDMDSDSLQRLDMNGADEPGPNDRDSNIAHKLPPRSKK
ncbi:MAG: hypothetical protein BWZ10_00548 [candidate division BRC1 bacterium ADurb.BinA364]|nr:MAG: hypothetical protein BWZ10_00548 [candidate division BRC1 bacterium ADurb.BinA364]